jgi:hypothetical protein
MHRMNVVVEQWQYEALKEQAHAQRTSVSRLLRLMIDQGLQASAGPAGKRPSVLDLVGSFDGPGDDGARRHDDLLYGKP